MSKTKEEIELEKLRRESQRIERRSKAACNELTKLIKKYKFSSAEYHFVADRVLRNLK